MYLENKYDGSANAGQLSGRSGHYVRRAKAVPVRQNAPKPQSFEELAQGSGNQPILDVLDRIGCGYVVFDQNRTVLKWNRAAESTLANQGEDCDAPKQIGLALRRFILSLAGQFPVGSLSWVVIPCKGCKPLVLQDRLHCTQDGTSIIVMLDREAKAGPSPETLQQMFGLTGAETQLALRLAQGEAPLDIARDCHLSRTTIRSQLAALFQKTETRRQAELVALLGRVSVLP